MTRSLSLIGLSHPRIWERLPDRRTPGRLRPLTFKLNLRRRISRLQLFIVTQNRYPVFRQQKRGNDGPCQNVYPFLMKARCSEGV